MGEFYQARDTRLDRLVAIKTSKGAVADDKRKSNHADRSKDSAAAPAELVDAARQYLPLVRAEPGVEAFYLTVRKDDPNTFVFYEIYRSQAAQDFHLQQDFTKQFLALLKSAQAGKECEQIWSNWLLKHKRTLIRHSDDLR